MIRMLFFGFLSTKISTFHNVNSHKAFAFFDGIFHSKSSLLHNKSTVFFVDDDLFIAIAFHVTFYY